MTRTSTPLAAVSLLALSITVWLAAPPAAAQANAPAEAGGLAPMIPPEALFYVERRGHEAVRDVFAASNLGRMASDEAMNQFIHATRIRVGQMIVKGLFSLQSAQEVDRYQKLLHELLKPFWYHPCAMYGVLDKGFSGAPGLGFLCATGKYQKECKAALEELMRTGVPAEGTPGTRQAFTYRKGATLWQGVAKNHQEFTLPSDPAKQMEKLRTSSVFLACWMGDVLFVATDLPAADAMSRMLSLAGPAKGKDADEGFRAVMAKTAMKDWAFRWYVDVAGLMKFAQAQSGGKLPPQLAMLGIDRLRGMGGTEGYADKLYARATYLYAPGGGQRPFRIFQAGGSYKPALAMVPESASWLFAGQLDTDALVTVVEAMTGVVPPPPQGQAGQAQPAGAKPDARLVAVLKQVRLLGEASSGHAAFCMGGLQGLMGVMMDGIPVGGVLALKDRDKAAAAIDQLVKLAGAEKADTDADAEAAKPKAYRNIPTHVLGGRVHLAVLPDRAIIAMSPNMMKSFIDAALDKMGGFGPRDPSADLAAVLGDGVAVFKLDLPDMAKTFWPMLMQMAERDPESFPIASMPSADKMARMLGPEIAVMSPDAEGLLLKSRGLVPFSTKMVTAYPAIAWGFLFVMMR